MKKSHESVFPHLNKALLACGDDDRMQPTKMAIQKAMSECDKVAKKRVRRESSAERFYNDALNKKKAWEDKLAEGMKKLALDQEKFGQKPTSEI